MYLHSHFNAIFNTFQPYGIRLFYGRSKVVFTLFAARLQVVCSLFAGSLHKPMQHVRKRPKCSHTSTKQTAHTRKNPRKKPLERILRPEWYRHNKGGQTRC